VGPFATFHFENYNTMRQQIQEMLFIEMGSDAQLEDELSTYNPLIPRGVSKSRESCSRSMNRRAALRCHRAWAALKTGHFSMSPAGESAASPIRPAKTLVPRGRPQQSNS
jgi:hypothetical protein